VGLPAVDDMSPNGSEATSETYRAFIYDHIPVSNRPPSEGGEKNISEEKRKRCNWGSSGTSTEVVSGPAMEKAKAHALMY
jgi:hypothetical protein